MSLRTLGPLSGHAIAELHSMAKNGPEPCCGVNPGVVWRLTRDRPPLAEVVELDSPFKTHKGKKIAHLKITDAGLQVVKDNP